MSHFAELRDLAALASSARARSVRGGYVDAVTNGGLSIRGMSELVSVGDRLTCFSRSGPVPIQVTEVAMDRVCGASFRHDVAIRRNDIVLLAPPDTGTPGEHWLGRVVDGLGHPVDGKGPIVHQAPNEEPARTSRDRLMGPGRIETPLRTGVNVIDIFTPLCFGQRLGIFAGSGVGKSTLLSMLACSHEFDVVVIGLIGERTREAREFVGETLDETTRQRAVLVVATSDEAAMMRASAADLAVRAAEHFRDQGKKVLLLLDSVTRYAHALREIGTAHGEPPMVRGYPPSVFAALPRLVERAGPALDGEGSITLFATVLVDGDDHNEPVGDALRGILDGHVVLSRSIASEGRYPPVDLTQSLSRLALRAWSEDQKLFVTEMRSLISLYEETRDLRLLGGWRRGADPIVDQAVDLVPVIYRAMRQSPGEAGMEEPFNGLARKLKEVQAATGQPPEAEQVRTPT